MPLSIQSSVTCCLKASRVVISQATLRHRRARAKWLRSPAALGSASLLLFSVISVTVHGQQKVAELDLASGSSLPDAPLPQFPAQSSTAASSSAEGAAIVSGVVLDSSGAAIPGAHISLTSRDRTQSLRLTSGGAGEFIFTGLPAGRYLIMVNAKGFAPFTSTEFDLSSRQAYEVPNLTLSVGSTGTEVTVRPIEEIAAEQIKAEEKQRFLGVIPNFYISYIPDPAPMTTRQKFSLASRDTFDPISLIGVGLVAGIEQANDKYPGRTSDFLSHAVFPSLFHQDPRYFYQGTGTVKSRLIHAASFAIITRSDSGKPMPNYSYFLGDIGSGALSNLYYPHADRGMGLVFTNAAIGIAGKAGGTIIREFFSKRLTTNVPPSGTQ
jgi:hypothetical protein